MRYEKVLLIRPGYKHSHYEYAGLPAGLGYISEALDRAEIEQEIVDMFLGDSYLQLKKRIRLFKPDLIGITMMSFRYKDHYRLLDKLKSEFKNIHIVAGGPHISTLREKVLDDCVADYGITLEGENTIVELCKGDKDLKDIKGLLYREDGKVLYTGDREFIKDLDGRGFSRYRFFQKNRYPQYVSIVTSRGCPNNCIFCPVRLTIGQRLRVRSSRSVVDEIEYWYKRGIRVFNIVDDNFTFYKQRIMDICDDVKKRSLKGLTLSCRNGIRADSIDREMLQAMKEVGFNYLAFGVESGSEKILKVLEKGESIKDIENAIREACELGYMVTLFFLIGSPYETEQDIRESLDFAKKYPVFDVRFYNLIPFPGTKLYEWVEKNNYFDKTPRDYLNNMPHWINSPVFRTPELPIPLRKKIYPFLNKEIKKHTLKTKLSFSKQTEGLFSNLGLPPVASKVLARLYYTSMFQNLFVETGITSRLRLKKFIKPKVKAFKI